jgi:hypothetical protein
MKMNRKLNHTKFWKEKHLSSEWWFILMSFVTLSQKNDMTIFEKETNTFKIDSSKKGFS